MFRRLAAAEIAGLCNGHQNDGQLLHRRSSLAGTKRQFAATQYLVAIEASTDLTFEGIRVTSRTVLASPDDPARLRETGGEELAYACAASGIADRSLESGLKVGTDCWDDELFRARLRETQLPLSAPQSIPTYQLS
jgi:hypothetical protein